MFIAPNAGVGEMPVGIVGSDVEAVLDSSFDLSDLSSRDRGIAAVGDGWGGVRGVNCISGNRLSDACFGLREG